LAIPEIADLTDVIVLGAGIVGVSVALHLQKRGRSVLLLDRREPGRETSFGNAGIIQREGVRPHEFPRDLKTLFRAALNLGLDARYDLLALPGFAPVLAQYWWHSAPRRYKRMVAEYAPLIGHAVSEHRELIAAAGAEDLIRKAGWYLVFRTEAARDHAFTEAEGDAAYGVRHARLDGEAMAKLEPDLKIRTAGALHWTDPWTVKNPGALVDAYVALFKRLGGTVAIGDGQTLEQTGAVWTVQSAAGSATAAEVVVAMGPWAKQLTRRLGYRLPLFVKRGYHMHYRPASGTTLNNWILDAEPGYLLAPMQQGIRLTTGAEFAPLGAPQNTKQLDGAERVARDFLPLGERVDPTPWMGARPCTPDMKPIIGAAPRHKGLWLAIGHAHHGLTLGPVTGRLLAEKMTGETPFLNMAPFAAERFGR
jgi:D-amino-acid dehydrogenase